MKEIIAKLISLANFKTTTVVMFIILSVLIMNNIIPNDNTVFYIIICMTISLYNIYNILSNNVEINPNINL